MTEKNTKAKSPAARKQKKEERRRQQGWCYGALLLVLLAIGGIVFWSRPKEQPSSKTWSTADPALGNVNAKVKIIEYSDFG